MTWSCTCPAAATRVAVIADRAVQPAIRPLVASLRSAGISTTVIKVSGGEALKTWAAAGRMLARLGAAGLQRNDCVVALGGGTVGDLAGFVAATYLRGIAWINVPTTLLAMVDSAIGGKTGVNLARGKNLAGTIWQPRAVICDPDVLASQDDRSYRSAFAEIVKYAMIVDTGLAADLDRDLDNLLARDREALTKTIRTCCSIKAGIVSSDERESQTGGLSSITATRSGTPWKRPRALATASCTARRWPSGCMRQDGSASGHSGARTGISAGRVR